ncbi:MAG TPA: sulfite exporter TauE/SafE family protein [Vicinamibacterales bacterium]|nr:sulfite exporter TauE/SafE family protein [Vicinamibacterales bacterium]
MLAAAILPGLLIGAALGLLGGGGSVLTVPIFVYVLGFPPKEAIAMSLAVVGATSAFGTASHWRAGNVNVRVALGFGAVAMLGTLFGVRIARLVPGATQLFVFAAVMLAAAAFMLRGGVRETDHRVIGRSGDRVIGRSGDRVIGRSGDRVIGRSGDRVIGESGDRAIGRAASVRTIVPAGLLVGALTGIVGVGGGFLIVPALVLMRLSVRQAVGTSLLVITGTCIVGLVGYLGHVRLDWTAVALVAAGTLPGIAAGSYVHRFVPQSALRRGFAAFLVIIAAFILLENLGPLSAVSRGR